MRKKESLTDIRHTRSDGKEVNGLPTSTCEKPHKNPMNQGEKREKKHRFLMTANMYQYMWRCTYHEVKHYFKVPYDARNTKYCL